MAVGGEALYVHRACAYRPDGEARLRDQIACALGDRWRKRHADETIAHLFAVAPQLAERPPLDRVNCKNGIFDFATGELVPHDPGLLTPIQLPALPRLPPQGDVSRHLAACQILQMELLSAHVQNRKEPSMTEHSNLRAAPGDRLIVSGHHQGEHERDGEVLEVHGEDGAPPYLVRWEDGTTALLYPSSDVSIQHFPKKHPGT